MFEDPRDIATQHTTNYEVVMPHPTQASREATSSSDEASSNIAAHYTQEGIKGGNKRHKQCP
jgi:hypothetical protein